MSEDVENYMRNLSDYELTKLLHKARPDRYPNPDTDPDIQSSLADKPT